MEPAAPTAASASAPLRADLLADARCLKCGYSLRGLPENRCPECGTSFEPADFAETYLPLWPLLLAWYLAACVAIRLLDLFNDVLGFWYTDWGRRWSGSFLIHDPWWLAETGILVILGPIGLFGLRRRRDWGRKVVMAMLIGTASTHIPALTPISLEDGGIQFSSPYFAEIFEWVVPPIALLIALRTGLRSRSLALRGHQSLVRLPIRRFPSWEDWLLVMVVLVVSLGATYLYYPAHYVQGILEYGGTFPLRLGVVCLINLATAGLYVAAGFGLWRRPMETRQTLARLFWLTFSVYPLAYLLDTLICMLTDQPLDDYLSESRALLGPLWGTLNCMWGRVSLLADALLPVAGLWLFARTLRQQDFDLLTRSQAGPSLIGEQTGD